MRCPYCGAEMVPGAKFCVNCRNPLPTSTAGRSVTVNIPDISKSYGFFDFSDPAKRAKNITIKFAKVFMVLTIIFHIIVGIALIIYGIQVNSGFLSEISDIGTWIIFGGFIYMLFGIINAIIIRIMALFILEMLEACEEIVHPKNKPARF